MPCVARTISIAAGIEDGLAGIKTLRAIQLSVQNEEPVTVADVTGASDEDLDFRQDF